MKHASCVRLAISIPTAITPATSSTGSKLGVSPTSASHPLPCASSVAVQDPHDLLIRGHSRSGAAAFPTKPTCFKECDAAPAPAEQPYSVNDGVERTHLTRSAQRGTSPASRDKLR